LVGDLEELVSGELLVEFFGLDFAFGETLFFESFGDLPDFAFGETLFFESFGDLPGFLVSLVERC